MALTLSFASATGIYDHGLVPKGVHVHSLLTPRSVGASFLGMAPDVSSEAADKVLSRQSASRSAGDATKERVSQSRIQSSAPAKEDKGIVVYVTTRRSGADAVRRVLKKRAQRHGWIPRRGPHGLCNAKPVLVNFDSERFLPSAEFGQPVTCSEVKSGAVVQSDVGYCETLNGTRPCRYLFVLRDPVAAMVAAYSIDCLASKDNKTSKISANNSLEDNYPVELSQTTDEQPTCPHMSFLDFARSIGNPSTAKIGEKRLWCSRTGATEDDLIFRQCMAHTTDVDFLVAQKRLAEPRNLALPLESFWASTGDGVAPGLSSLATFLGDASVVQVAQTMRRPQVGDYQPTETELRALKQILKHDLALYEMLVH